MDQQLDGNTRAILADAFLLVADGLAGPLEFLEFLLFHLAPFRRRERSVPVDCAQFRGGIAGELFERVVEQAQAAIQVPHCKGLRGVFEKLGQEFFLSEGFAQGCSRS